MKVKVIYISFIRLTEKTARDWYINDLIKMQLEVEFWDVVNLVRNEYSEIDERAGDYSRIIKSYAELESLLANAKYSDARFVILVSYASFTVKLFRILSKYKCQMYYFAWGAIPVRPLSLSRRISALVFSPVSTIKDFCGRIKSRMYRKLGLVNKFAVVFAAGRSLIDSQNNAEEIVPINFADYEQFLKEKNTELISRLPEKYAVFLDVYMPHHADFAILGWRNVAPGAYYNDLNRFFDIVERQYDIRVIIAAHPRADYRNINPFCGREVIFGETPTLVAHSQFVILHSSLSLSYAVLNEKPAIFTYTDEMYDIYINTSYMHEIFDAADFLKSSIYNISRLAKDSNVIIYPVDSACYEKYKYKYLTTVECENCDNAKIVYKKIVGVPLK